MHMNRYKKWLVDWFIPHESNSHKPHSIRPKHLAFHAGAALFLKGIFLFVLSIFPSSLLLASDALIIQSQSLITMTNAIRSSLDLEALVMNPLLSQAAISKSNDMAVFQYFSHTSPNGWTISDWLAQVGYSYSTAGENLAVGFATPEGVINGWKKSPSHYSNLIDPNFSEIGIGVTPGIFNEKETSYIVQLFGSLKTPKATMDTNITQINSIESPIKQATLDVEKEDNIIKVSAEVEAAPNTESITIHTQETSIELVNNEQDPTQWKGVSEVVKNTNPVHKPVVLAAAVSKNSSGETHITDIEYSDISPLLPSFTETYSYYKSHPSRFLSMITRLIDSYYYSALILLSLSLVLAIIVQIRRQHLHLVASTLGVILLLTLLIKF